MKKALELGKGNPRSKRINMILIPQNDCHIYYPDARNYATAIYKILLVSEEKKGKTTRAVEHLSGLQLKYYCLEPEWILFIFHVKGTKTLHRKTEILTSCISKGTFLHNSIIDIVQH